MGGRYGPATVLFSLATLSLCFAQGSRTKHSYHLFSGVSYQENAIHGGNASLSFNLLPRLSLVADFSAHQQAEEGIATDIFYGLFGGELFLGEYERMRPFARLTTGVSHWRRETYGSELAFVTGTRADFVVGVGGGVDLPWTDRFKFRVIQIDYLTRPVTQVKGDLRVSFGLVFSF